MSFQNESTDNMSQTQSLDAIMASNLDEIIQHNVPMTDEEPHPNTGVPMAVSGSGADLESKESSEQDELLSRPLRVVFNADEQNPDGLYSIGLDRKLVLMNWPKSIIATALEAEPTLPMLNLKMDPIWLTDYGRYAIKKTFEQYINHNDNSIPEPKWITDGSQIDATEHCGGDENYRFIMSFASEACCEQVLSKYPHYALPPNEEDEVGGLVPGSYNFWYSLKEADAEYEQKTTEETEKYFMANFPKEFCDEFREKILPEGKTFMEAFDCNEFEAVMGMIQLVGVNLLKDLASIGEYLGLTGLVRLAAMVIGEQIRYWPKVEACIEQVYEQRIADIRKEVEEEERLAKEKAASGESAAAAAAVPVDDDDDEEEDEDEDD